MAQPQSIQLQRVNKGFGNLSKASTQLTKDFGKMEKQTKSLGGVFSVLERHVGSLTAGLLARGAWESGLKTMGELQELSIDAARAIGAMNKQGEIMGKVFEGAAELGISFQQMAGAMKAAAKFHAQMGQTNEEFLKATKSAAAFGEATGMGAERGAEMMGELVGYAKVTPKELKSVQNEFVHLQRSIGLTGEDLAELAKGITPLINQIKNLGATSSDVEKLVKASGNMTAGFAAMGKSAGQATQFMERLLDPERFNENIVLFNRLGVSADKALSAMMGEDTGKFLDDISERLPEISKQIVSMGPMAGAQMAKQLGLQWRDVLDFQKMGSAEAKKRAKELEKERKDEEAFQKQLNETLKTWQRTFVSITHMFDAVRMRFASILGGQNFVKMQKMFADFANDIMDMFDVKKGGIDVAKYIGQALDTIKATIPIIMPMVQSVVSLTGKAVEWFSKMFKWSEKVFGKKGPMMMALGALGLMKSAPLVGAVLGVISKVRGSSRRFPMYVENVNPLGGAGGGGIIESLKRLFRGGGATQIARRGSQTHLDTLFDAQRARIARSGIGPQIGAVEGGGGMLSKIGGMAGKAAPWVAVAMAAYGGIRAAFFDDENIRKAFGKSNTEVIKGSERFAAGVVGALDSLTFGLIPDDIKTRMMKHINEKGVIKTILEWGPFGTSVRIAEAVFDEKNVRKILGKTDKEAVTFADRLGAGMANAFNVLGFMDEKTVQNIAKAGAKVAGGIQRVATAGAKGAVAGPAGSSSAALAESFKILIENTDAYNDALKKGMTEQQAWNEGLFKGGILFGASINDVADILDNFGMGVDKIANKIGRTIIDTAKDLSNAWNNAGTAINSWNAEAKRAAEKFFKNIYNSFVNKFLKPMANAPIEFLKSIDRAIGDWEYNARKAVNKFTEDAWQKVVDIWNGGFTGLVKGIKAAFLGWIEGAQRSWGTGMKHWMFRLMEMIHALTGDVFIKEEDLGKTAKSMMADTQQTYDQLIRQYAQATSVEEKNVLAEQINDLAKSTQDFVENDQKRKDEGFYAINKHLEKIVAHTESTAGSGAQTARATQQIADNTRKPRRFIDINSLAIRGNESRNIFFSYGSPTGQA